MEGGPALTIVDSGGGIDDSELAHLFEPFYTTKPAGTGLGLAIAHEIARARAARIDVDSVPGQTTFRISFPGAHHVQRTRTHR